MNQKKKHQKRIIEDCSDARLLPNCVYCDGPIEDRDHIPPKVFLNEPYPENMDVLNSCRKCNGGNSKDEEYVAAAIEIAKKGTLELASLRKKIAAVLNYQTKLYEAFKCDVVSVEPFELKIDIVRFKNVFQKLARGHAAHELSYFDLNENCEVFWTPVDQFSREDFDFFMESPEYDLWPEIGSRGFQRVAEHGKYVWVDLQKDQYSYLVFEHSQGTTARILINNYLAVEAFFSNQ